MLTKFIEHLRVEFKTVLMAKTGWGRNQIILAFEQAICTALAKTMDESVDLTNEKGV
jgi:hypothetical protein